MSLPSFAAPGASGTPGVPDILAAGAQLKSTYTLTKGSLLFPGQYLGDLGQLETAEYYKKSLAHFIGLYGIEPGILAFDKHPGYAAAGLAREFAPNAALCPVQHHHAHLASVLLDNGSFEPVIGAIFDGTGYGEDGTIWGGEFLVGDAEKVERMGSLRPFRLPGGENAIREPWRCALALLNEALGGEKQAESAAFSLWPDLAPRAGAVLSALEAAPVTTSCGRLFDGFSALLGLCPAATYDGQAAMALENAAREINMKMNERKMNERKMSERKMNERPVSYGVSPDVLPFDIEPGGSVTGDSVSGSFVQLDWRGAVKAFLGAALPKAMPSETAFGPVSTRRSSLARAFHLGLARAVAEVCVLLRDRTNIGRVALSGGVWQNALLLDMTREELFSRGFTVLTHGNISPNDEGVSAGQAAIAARRFRV
jgi:hydrogenase maturation protein HypF